MQGVQARRNATESLDRPEIRLAYITYLLLVQIYIKVSSGCNIPGFLLTRVYRQTPVFLGGVPVQKPGFLATYQAILGWFHTEQCARKL